MLEIEKVMESESVQNIFSFASIWNEFTVDDLVKAIGYSKESLYNGLKTTRGRYFTKRSHPSS